VSALDIQLEGKVDTSRFDRAVARYTEELKIELPRAVKTAARLLAVQLMRFTPPKSQAQGRAAVKRDIGNAMWLPDPAATTNKHLQRAILAEDFDVVQAFITNTRGAFKNYHLQHFNPSLHTSRRGRGGRVRGKPTVMVLERAEYKRYVREVQGHVGATKYAFGAAAQRLGEASIPAWILKHHASLGQIEEDYNPNNPSVTITDKSPGAESISPSTIQDAINVRTRAMTADIERITAGGASRYFI
jgi:hypothetical protein